MTLWFRFYTEALHDPKVQTLAAGDFRAWVNLLCIAKDEDKGGILPDRATLAFKLRQKPYAFSASLERLVAAGLVEESRGVLQMHAWGKRQFVSDSSTHRVRQYRKRNVAGNDNETLQKRSRDRAEAETEQKQSRAEAEAEAAAACMKAYESSIGSLTATVAQRIEEAVVEYGETCVLHCLEEAATNNARSWKYASAIMARHVKDGCFAERANGLRVDPEWIAERAAAHQAKAAGKGDPA